MAATTADRVERFLTANPSGSLMVAVGYASAFGLAWLQERTRRRPVSVLIGDTRTAYWQNMTSSDRAAARRFLHRRDVEVHNWYRTGQSSNGRSEAHLKAWLVYNQTRVVAALVGSANLTQNGLYKNVEIMVEPAADDFADIWAEAHTLWGKSWDAKDRLIRYLDGDFASTPPKSGGGRQKQPSRPSPSRSSQTSGKDTSRRPSRQSASRRKRSKSFSPSEQKRQRGFSQ